MNKASSEILIISDNKKAFFNYHIEETFEAGLVLRGSEVKSLRINKGNIKDAYCVFKGNELFLINAHISIYKEANLNNHEPLRSRKLLLKKNELLELSHKIKEKGLSIIPIKLFFKKGKVKIDIALGRGKKVYDKRKSIKERELKRNLDSLRKKSYR